MLKTLRNAWAVPEIRTKLLFTVLILVLYRLGASLPIPFIDYDQIHQLADVYSNGSAFSYLNTLSGGAFGNATLLALSVSPYITASIVMQLLGVAIPALEKIAKNGEEGRKKIERITRYVTVGLALVTSFGYYRLLRAQGGDSLFTHHSGDFADVFAAIVIIGCYTAGACIVMWLAQKIDEQGIGNGISIILFANIVANFPTTLYNLFITLRVATDGLSAVGTSKYYQEVNVVGTAPAHNGDTPLFGVIIYGALTILIIVASIIFVTYMSDAERRIPVQYAKRTQGRKLYGGQSSNLPIKLNMSGVMPIIFASTIVSLPTTIIYLAGGYNNGGFWQSVYEALSSSSMIYALVLLVLIIAFAYFYSSISFNPVEVSNNIQQNGGSIPGIRPGRPTAQYIKKVVNKVVLMGAFFLSIVAIVPIILNIISGGLLNVVSFTGSTLLIVVGVTLETFRELEGQITMRHYKGFLE